MNFFLIDLENWKPSSHDVTLIDDISADDQVHIFFTDSVPYLSLSFLSQLSQNHVRVFYHNAFRGTKNALDFQLSSFLGYLIAQDGLGEHHCYIVSKDTGYDCLADFWKSENISRIDSLEKPREKAEMPHKETRKVTKIQITVKANRAVQKPKAARKTPSLTELKKVLPVKYHTLLPDIMEILRTQTDRVDINNGFVKLCKSSKKGGEIYKYLKPYTK